MQFFSDSSIRARNLKKGSFYAKLNSLQNGYLSFFEICNLQELIQNKDILLTHPVYAKLINWLEKWTRVSPDAGAKVNDMIDNFQVVFKYLLLLFERLVHEIW